MTTAPTTQRRRGRGFRRAAAAAAVIGMAMTGVAAVSVPAFAAEARPAAAVEAYATPVAIEYVAPASSSERAAPDLARSVFFGSALALGAGGVVTARLLAHRHHKAVEAEAKS